MTADLLVQPLRALSYRSTSMVSLSMALEALIALRLAS
jgi:hypothetical protein